MFSKGLPAAGLYYFKNLHNVFIVVFITMPKIISAGTADAPYKLPQSEVKNFIYNLYAETYHEIEKMISVFDNAAISGRHISVPMEWLGKDHSFSERNAIFRQKALELSEKAIIECVTGAGASFGDINNIVFVTSTGVSAPTIDALLFNSLKLNRHIKRTPLWGLGCAGGAAGNVLS